MYIIIVASTQLPSYFKKPSSTILDVGRRCGRDASTFAKMANQYARMIVNLQNLCGRARHRNEESRARTRASKTSNGYKTLYCFEQNNSTGSEL